MTYPAEKLFIVGVLSCLCLGILLFDASAAFGQQTLGGITGTVTDATGGALTDSQVTLVADGTKPGVYRWDIHMQGDAETVFFEF